jgi:hypothetical protein
MTTLVYRAGVLASDSRGTRGDRIEPGRTQKIMQLADGRLIGVCGGYASSWRYATWLAAVEASDTWMPTSLRHGPKLCGSATVVEVLANGRLMLHEEGGVYPAPEDTEFHAWGSGMEAALGALHMGATAEQAVQVATRIDTGSGGQVQSARLKSRPRAGSPRRQARPQAS